MRGRWLLVLALGAATLLAGRALASGYADWLWFDAMGAAPLWTDRFWFTLIARGGSGLVAGAFVFANLYAVRLSVVSLVLPRRLANLEIGEEVPGRHLVIAAALIALFFGWLLALPADAWQQLALIQRGLPFGETDPYFELDLSFFVYWLPLERALYFGALIAVLLTGALVTFIYSLTPSLRWERGKLHLSNYARRHLLVLAAVLLLLIAWSFRLDEYRTLLAGSGVEGSFSYSDYRATIPSNQWLSLFAFGAAFALLAFGWARHTRLATAALIVLLVAGVGLREIWPVVVRRTATVGDPAMREMPFQLVRAQYSRRAFAVDLLVVGDSALSYAAPRAAAAAISSWDPSVLLLVASRRAHGDALSVGWRARSGTLVAEIPVRLRRQPGDSALPGWSVECVLAASADSDGAAPPPPDSAASVVPLNDVLVYEGAPNDMLVVADTGGTIPAPSLTNTRARLAFGWSAQRLSLLGTEFPGPSPRAIVTRDARERVAALAPFFAQGSAVAPVLTGSALYWVIDLYSASATYPLSRRDTLGGVEYAYVHHAAVAVVNAHTGRVVLVRDEKLDALAASWARLFPTIFVDRTTMPRALLEALPPAADGARLQARMLARYGRRGDTPPAGDVPSALPDSLPAAVHVGPFALPRASGVAWSAALLDANEHLSGVVVATGGADRRSYWIPLERPGMRWATIAGQLKLALDSALVAVAGTRVIRGYVIAVPMRGGVAFAQSAYGVRGDAPPVLLRSAVLTAQGVATGRSVSQALGAPMPGADGLALSPAGFRARVAALYAEMRAALARGDWPAFGRAYDALGVLLARRERQP